MSDKEIVVAPSGAAPEVVKYIGEFNRQLSEFRSLVDSSDNRMFRVLGRSVFHALVAFARYALRHKGGQKP